MAKNKTHKQDTKLDLDMDMDELDGLGEDMAFADEDGIDDDNRKPSRSKVVRDLAKDAGEGALESVIRNTAKKALPEEYSANYHEAMDIASFTSEVVEKNKQALNKSAFKLGKEVKKLLPFKLGLLDKYLDSQQSQFESFKTQTEEQLREAGIGSETAAIFDKQLDVQKSLYARSEAQAEVQQREKLVQDKLSNDVLANMDSNIAIQSAFTTQISKEYYKRSLELQFKSYYVQADTLKTMREHYKAFTIQFTNIEKNTGLPDFVKLRNTEKLHDMLREQTVQSVYTNLIGNSKYLATMKKKMGGFVQEKVEGVTGAMDGASEMLDMVNSSAEGSGTSALGMIGSMLASMGGDTLGEKIAGKISPRIKAKLKDNKYLNTGANYLGTLGASPSSLLEAAKLKAGRKKDELSDEGTPGRWTGSKVFGGLYSLLEAGTPGADKNEVTRAGYLTHNQPAIFDNKTHRSVTEVIPMYLARILQSNANLTSMYSQSHGGIQGGVGLLTYDFEGRKLTGEEVIARNIQSSLLKEKSVAGRSKALGQTVLNDVANTATRSGLDKAESAKLKKYLTAKTSTNSLADYIEKASTITGEEMDFDTLFKNYETNDKLKDLVETDPKLKKLVDTIRLHAPQSTEQVDSRFKDLTRNYPLEAIKSLFVRLSQLARAATPHLLKDTNAQSLSRAFVNYLLKTGKDVTPQSVLDRTCFTYLLAKDAKEDLMESIAIFVHDVKRVTGTQDIQMVSSMELLFALVNKSLREDRDIDPSVFQSLSELYPEIVAKGELTARNLREGDLKIGEEEPYIDSAALIEAGSRKAVEINELRQDRTRDNFFDRAMKSGKEGLKNAAQFAKANRSDPSAIAAKLLETLKNAKTSVAGQLSEQTSKIQSDLAQFFKDHELDPKSLQEGGLNKLVQKYDALINRLETMASLMQTEIEENTQLINNTQTNINYVSNDPGTQQEVGKLTKGYHAASIKSVELLRKTVETLKAQRTEIESIRSDEGADIKGKLTRVKLAISKGVTSINDALKNYETAGKDVFSNMR